VIVVGVPLMMPVVSSKLRPTGSVGVIVYLKMFRSLLGLLGVIAEPKT
jgi:hypothetical protein